MQGCNIVAMNRGIVAECVLELSCVQNHINCKRVGIDAVDCDQCFFMANLIYHNHGQGKGIHITGQGKPGTRPSTSHCVNGNCIVGVQVCMRFRCSNVTVSQHARHAIQ